MTINVAVVTPDALIMGCDSIASTTQYFLDPFGPNSNITENDDGSVDVSFRYEHLTETVTNAWGGVTKMFQISKWPHPNVAAVTAGLAKLNGLPISSIASDFMESRLTPTPTYPADASITVESVARDFLTFMRERYDEHYRDSQMPEQLRHGPMFLIGGMAQQDRFPSLYRVNVQGNNVLGHYADGTCGVAWEGQSDAVERVLRGYDTEVKRAVDAAIQQYLTQYRETVAASVAAAISSMVEAHPGVLEGAQVTLPEPGDAAYGAAWDSRKLGIQYSNLPLQDAVDLVAYFVNMQAGRSKFGTGVATVGGRTHIGVITKQGGFKMLDEPELRHANTGYSL